MWQIDSVDNHLDDLWINENHLAQLLLIFNELSTWASKWSNIELMKQAITRLRNQDPVFRCSLRQNDVTRMVTWLIKKWLIKPRKYPKKRSKPTIDGRLFLTTTRVVNILERNKDTFISFLQADASLERAYKAFAIYYNNNHLNEYFPIDWDTVDQRVRDRVRALLEITSSTKKVNSLPEVKYASKEDIISHQYFRHYLAQWLIRLKWESYHFHHAMFLLLQKWNTWYSALGLRLPTHLTRAKWWRNSLQDILWIPNTRTHTVLNALCIDIDVWEKMELTPEMRWPLSLLPNVSIFNARPLESIDE